MQFQVRIWKKQQATFMHLYWFYWFFILHHLYYWPQPCDNWHSGLQMRQGERLQKVTKELETRYRVLLPFSYFSTSPAQKKTTKLYAPISYSCTVMLTFRKVKMWQFKIFQMPPIAWTCYFFIMKQSKCMTFLIPGAKLSPCRCSVTTTGLFF